MTEPLLSVQNLKVVFRTEDGLVPAVDDVSFDIGSGETVGLVGESGCGKSVTALSILRLIEWPGHITSGKVLFKGKDLLKASPRRLRALRGKEISMIFQEPMTSLNPVYTIGDQLMEAIRLHCDTDSPLEEAIRALRLVGIPEPRRRISEYPHQMSGGMRQRVMIAMAMVSNPSLLIADEPTTALDVTIQAQILELMSGLRERFNTSILMISHDLGVIAETCHRVIIMYSGVIVESGTVREVFRNPLHPYTEGLLKSIPRMDTDARRLYTIRGTVPNPLERPQGCRFHPRCEAALAICRQKEPPLISVGDGRTIRCWREG